MDIGGYIMNFKKTLSIIFTSIVFASSLFSMGEQSNLLKTCNKVMKDELAHKCAEAIVPTEGLWSKLGYGPKVRDVFAAPGYRGVLEIESRFKSALRNFYATVFQEGRPETNLDILLFAYMPAPADRDGVERYKKLLNGIAGICYRDLFEHHFLIEDNAAIPLIKAALVAEFKKITNGQIKKFIEARSANPSLLKPVNVARVAVAAGTAFVLYYTWGTIVACYHSAYPQDHELTDQMQTQLGMLFAGGAEFLMEKVAPKAVCFYDGWFYARTAALTSLAVGGITLVVKQPGRLINWARGFESKESDAYLLA